VSRDILEISDLDAGELTRVLDLATNPALPPLLAGRGVALLFEKPSARTRHSTEMAVVQLGGHPITAKADEVGIDTRESAEDVARTMACYHAVICARVFRHEVLERMAGAVDIPVVNLLSDRSHPLQALADLLTLRQRFGSLDGRTVAWLGDFSNVARSLALGCALSGAAFRFAGPAGYGPGPADLAAVAALGGSIEVFDRPEPAAAGADCVTTDAWYSMGQEHEAAERAERFRPFTVDAAVMAAAASQAVFLHCLPAHRGQEVTDEVLDGPASLVWAQATNRLHAARAALAFCLGAGRPAR
jgi:ornithine carbamoyltransferase